MKALDEGGQETDWLEYFTARAKAGLLPLVAHNIISEWRRDREKLLAEIYELKKGVPLNVVSN